MDHWAFVYTERRLCRDGNYYTYDESVAYYGEGTAWSHWNQEWRWKAAKRGLATRSGWIHDPEAGLATLKDWTDIYDPEEEIARGIDLANRILFVVKCFGHIKCNTFGLYMKASDRVDTVKARIREAHQIPPYLRLCLYDHDRGVLRDGRTLSDYNFKPGCENDIDLIVQVALKVSMLSGTTTTIEVQGRWSIRHLKNLIRHLKNQLFSMGFSPDQQRLIFAGELLDDYSRVSDNNFPPDCTLTLAITSDIDSRCSARTSSSEAI